MSPRRFIGHTSHDQLQKEPQVDYKLEAIVLPVSDVDRAKAFYADQCGFVCDVDHQPNDSFRVVQFTPPGSACSITFGIGMSTKEPGSYEGLHLVVADIEAAHAELAARGLGSQRAVPLRPGGQDAGRRSHTAGLRHVLLVQRPRRQRMAAPGGPEPGIDLSVRYDAADALRLHERQRRIGHRRDRCGHRPRRCTRRRGRLRTTVLRGNPACRSSWPVPSSYVHTAAAPSWARSIPIPPCATPATRRRSG